MDNLTSLRDRIAAVLSQHDVNLPDKVADAVIAALGLQEEHRERSYGNWPGTPQAITRKQHRYVTEWTTDE